MDFKAALRAIGPRPWERPVFDDVDRWVERMRGPPHRCVCIFIDNSGGDIILGVLPFVEEMLRRGTTVLLCANSRPILNDVTYAELSYILGQVIKILSKCSKKFFMIGRLDQPCDLRGAGRRSVGGQG